MLIRLAVVAAGASLLLAGPAAAATTSPSAVPSATSTPSVVTPTEAAPTAPLTSEIPEPVASTPPGVISVPAGNAYSTEQHGASATDLAALLAAGVALAGGGTVLVLRRRS